MYDVDMLTELVESDEFARDRSAVQHALAEIASSPEEILEGTFAERFFTSREREGARRILRVQGRAVD